MSAAPFHRETISQQSKERCGPILDTRHWHSIFDLTLTLKQRRKSRQWKVGFYATQIACHRAFWHFKDFLNRAVYGTAVRRYGKRLRVIPVLEKLPTENRLVDGGITT